MRRLVVTAVLVIAACKSKSSPAPEPVPQGSGSSAGPVAAPPIDRVSLLAGKLPEDAKQTELINVRCRICHSEQYLTQQRLSEAGWTKTIAKMRKLGAQLSDEQAADLAKFAATYWNPDLPARTFPLVAPPAGALPLADK